MSELRVYSDLNDIRRHLRKIGKSVTKLSSDVSKLSKLYSLAGMVGVKEKRNEDVKKLFSDRRYITSSHALEEFKQYMIAVENMEAQALHNLKNLRGIYKISKEMNVRKQQIKASIIDTNKIVNDLAKQHFPSSMKKKVVTVANILSKKLGNKYKNSLHFQIAPVGKEIQFVAHIGFHSEKEPEVYVVATQVDKENGKSAYHVSISSTLKAPGMFGLSKPVELNNIYDAANELLNKEGIK